MEQLRVILILIASLCAVVSSVEFHGNTSEDSVTVKFYPVTVALTIGESRKVALKFSKAVNASAQLFFNYDKPDKIELLPNVDVHRGDVETNITVTGKSAGYVSVGVNSTDDVFSRLDHVFLHITVVHSNSLYVIGQIVGWIYFLAWSVSFYPQIYCNWKRKSVIGLNFDFLALNIVGFTLYSIFNIALYFSPEVQKEYHDLYPRALIPVELNDVIFPLHALVVTSITITQCCIYERGDQRVSFICRGILAIYMIVVVVSLFVVIGHKMSWLNYMYIFSYIKLTVTLIKYSPQAVMNFRRQSTEGWSIGNVMLDFTGGSFSILQMFIISYNRNDWQSVFGNPTKFGLGLFTVIYDLIFMFQHYVLYRGNSPQAPYEEINNTDVENEASSRQPLLNGNSAIGS